MKKTTFHKTIIKASILTAALVSSAHALADSKLCPGVREPAHDHRELAMRHDISNSYPGCSAPSSDAEICDCLNHIQDELDKFDCQEVRSTTEAFFCDFKSGLNMELFKIDKSKY